MAVRGKDTVHRIAGRKDKSRKTEYINAIVHSGGWRTGEHDVCLQTGDYMRCPKPTRLHKALSVSLPPKGLTNQIPRVALRP